MSIVYQENANGWITAFIPEFPGAISQGKTRAEAREMVLDALNELMLAARQQFSVVSGGDEETLDFEITVEKTA